MVKLSSFATDEDLSVNGQWFEYADGVEFKIAKWNNPKFRDYLEDLARPHARKLRKSGRVGRFWNDLVNKAAARCVLLDWKGVDGDDGEPLTYSQEEGEKVLNNTCYSSIHDFIVEIAMEDANYFTEETEAAGKNSSERSAGKSSGANTKST